MQQFKDNQGNSWVDFTTLSEQTKQINKSQLSANTVQRYIADGGFKEGLHYVKQDSSNRVYYRLDLCLEVHKERLQAHKKNLKAGNYLNAKKDPSQKKKHQTNILLTSSEVKTLEALQKTGEFVRCKEVKCGDLVLRSDAEPLSVNAIAAELLRRALAEQTVRLLAEQADAKIMSGIK